MKLGLACLSVITLILGTTTVSQGFELDWSDPRYQELYEHRYVSSSSLPNYNFLPIKNHIYSFKDSNFKTGSSKDFMVDEDKREIPSHAPYVKLLCQL